MSVTGAAEFSPATKLNCDSCAAEIVVIWPLGSAVPLSTQKPCDGPVLMSSI